MKITELINYLKQDTYDRELSGQIVSSINDIQTHSILDVNKIDNQDIVFDYFGKPLRIQLKNLPDDIEMISSSALFWLSSIKDTNVKINYLPFLRKDELKNVLEIGVSESVLKTSGHDIRSLFKELIFESNGSNFIFIETFLSKKDKSLAIHGLKYRAFISVQDGKWILEKITKQAFSRSFDHFSNLCVAVHSGITFVEPDNVRVAQNALQQEIARGNTLLSLWNEYSEIESARAENLSRAVGFLEYEILTELPENKYRLRMLDLNESKQDIIEEYWDEVISSSLQLKTESKSEKALLLKILKINSDWTFEVKEKTHRLPPRGLLSLSNLGQKKVLERREKARTYLMSSLRPIPRSLMFAMEGKIEGLSQERRKYKALTERTRTFLKERFDLDNLTPNQAEAVDIAVNTPDIAIIQGPPGTGKSTVIAAICERLLEIYEKEQDANIHKAILVSAFQNDTVDHIASKIYTLGLPTVKVGRKTTDQAETRMIHDLIEKIETNLNIKNTTLSRMSTSLENLIVIYLNERDIDKVVTFVEGIRSKLSETLLITWDDLSSRYKRLSHVDEQQVELLESLPVTVADYVENYKGYATIRKFTVVSKLPFSREEKSLLDSPPLDDVTPAYIEQLLVIKKKYLGSNNPLKREAEINESVVLWLKDAAKELRRQEELGWESDEDSFIVANLELMKKEILENKQYIRDAIEHYSHTMAATNQIAGSYELNDIRNISTVVLEEAARSNPLDLIIPMVKAVERILLVGDHKQLPHLLEPDIADELLEKTEHSDVGLKLNQSLFEVLFKNLSNSKVKRVITLNEQFRMHPFIGSFINRMYYPEILLKTGMPEYVQLRAKSHQLTIPWAKNKVTVFKNVADGLEKKGKSKSRLSEVKSVFDIVDEIMKDPQSSKLSIGIITFYSGQVNELLKEGIRRGYVQKHEESFEIAKPYKFITSDREKFRIGTVDSFQGKEFDIIVLSTVRSNKLPASNQKQARSKFGFLTLDNRLNVAFSRAQRMIITVGDGSMFNTEEAKLFVPGLHEFYTKLSKDETYGSRI